MPHIYSSKGPEMKKCQAFSFRLGCVKVISSACLVKCQTYEWILNDFHINKSCGCVFVIKVRQLVFLAFSCGKFQTYTK